MHKIKLHSVVLSVNDAGVTQDGTAALHWAAKTTLLRCVNRLLELGAAVNAADKVCPMIYVQYYF